jgi:hypothetical protein
VLQFEFDQDANSVAARVSNEPEFDLRKIDKVRVLEYDIHGDLVGIEFLDVGLGVDLTDLPYHDELARFFGEHHIPITDR